MIESLPEFYEAIRQADPEDDGPTLLFADWLEEHGDYDRAEFIRLSVASAHGANVKRRQRLLKRHSEKWRRELPWIHGVHWPAWERGLTRTIEIQDAEVWNRESRRILEAAPISRLRANHFTYSGYSSYRLLEAEHIQAWLRSSDISRLPELDFYYLDGSLAASLPRRGPWMNLRHLRLSDCVFYNRNPAPLFADPAAFPTLEHLTLTQHRFNHISEHAVSQLLNSLPPRLQSLNFGRAPFQAEGIREWLQIPQSRQLSGGIRFWLSQSQLEILDAIVRNLGSWRVDCAPDPAQGFGVWLRPAD